MRLQGLQGAARVLTIVSAAAAAGVALATAVALGQFALAVAVLLALLLRLRSHTERWRHIGAITLVLAVGGVVGAAGGPRGSMLVVLLFLMADYGLSRPLRQVVPVGLAAVVVTAAVAVLGQGLAIVAPDWVWAVLLVPLVGVTAGQVGGRQSLDGTAALESATKALDEVLALAERIPAGFDRWSVAAAVQLELGEACGAEGDHTDGAHLLLVQDDVLFGVAGRHARRPVGLLDDVPRPRSARRWVRVRATELPAPLAATLRHDRWYLHRLGGRECSGVVLVPDGVSAAVLEAVGEVLRPAAVALANVARFERLESLADSSARRRVAHDLHDGVAQALTHVRFELDLLALEHEDLTDDFERIRGVADAALLEVRRTVGGLRDGAPLAERISRHVDLLSSFAPAEILVELPPDLEVSDDLADDVFRICQEALSNAVRHAGASTIRLAVHVDDGALSLLVADDGRGLLRDHEAGVGLTGMRSRAERIGGELAVRSRRAGGTVVELVAPLSPSHPPTTPTDTLTPPQRSS